MPARPVLPELAVAKVRRYCETRVPARHLDKLRVECETRGKSITIYERRPPWHERLGPEWSKSSVAQLRYEPEENLWRLYCADRNSRWHYYDMVEPTERIDELLQEIEDDPTGIFWG